MSRDESRSETKPAEAIDFAAVDDNDETLIRRVHPRDWKNPKPAKRYNLVVIGAGTAGLVAAAGASGLGARVALIERRLMGGDCLNFGCVPSKALLASAHALRDVADSKRLGVVLPSGEVEADFPAIMERMRAIRSRISRMDSAERFRDELGVDVFLGDARFESRNGIEVAGETLRFRKAVIATGARPFMPPIPGLDTADPLTNETIFSLTERPDRLLIIGGGPIGCELAQAFASFGSRVTLVEIESQFLPREDPEAAEILRDALVADGIEIRLSTRVAGIESRNGEKVIRIESDSEEQELAVDEILVGAGRVPNVEGLGLDRAGVTTHRGGVVVDDHLRTRNPDVYAAGDVCMAQKFTHAADFAARAIVQNALFFGHKKLSSLTIPWCTYTRPEIAHVGLTEQEARHRGIELDTYRRDFSEVDRTIAEASETGFVKIHTKRGSDQIVGATIVAQHAGDLISEVSVAMAGGVGLSALASVIHPYPTRAEAIRQIGDAYNRTRLTPTVSGLFDTFLRWTR